MLEADSQSPYIESLLFSLVYFCQTGTFSSTPLKATPARHSLLRPSRPLFVYPLPLSVYARPEDTASGRLVTCWVWFPPKLSLHPDLSWRPEETA